MDFYVRVSGGIKDLITGIEWICLERDGVSKGKSGFVAEDGQMGFNENDFRTLWSVHCILTQSIDSLFSNAIQSNLLITNTKGVHISECSQKKDSRNN